MGYQADALSSLFLGGCPTGKGMSWAQAILLARGLSRGWGGICSTALTGAPFSQVTASHGVERGRQAWDLLTSPPSEASSGGLGVGVGVSGLACLL